MLTKGQVTHKRGRLGFDAGNKILGACREGSESRKSKAAFLQLPMMTTTVPN